MSRLKKEVIEEKVNKNSTSLYLGDEYIHLKVEGRGFLNYKPHIEFSNYENTLDYEKWSFSKNGTIKFDGHIKSPDVEEVLKICDTLSKLDSTMELIFTLRSYNESITLVLSDKKLKKISGFRVFFKR